jgi:glucose-6-phosphate dehydrogenase assembly protein OpcA
MSNAVDAGAQEFISGKLAHVNVAQIERELRSLWKEAAQGDVDSGTGTVVRACSFNLVLFTDEDDAETRCSDLLDEIESHHPCRALLAVFRPDRAHSLNAWVSARCHLSGASKQICSEQITVCCEGGRPEELASVVLPLVLPDLPVLIWWRQKRINWQSLKALHASARRFIIDSGRLAFDQQIFLDVQQLIEQSGNSLFVSDLNWRRLQGWCHAIADAFDGFPMQTETLSKVNRVTLTFSGDKTVSNRVLLLTGWLASRLGWQPVKLDLSKGAQFKTLSGPVEVLFVPDPTPNEPGHLRSLQFEFEGEKGKLSISPERTAEARYIIARRDDTQENEATRVSNVRDESMLIGQELEVLSRDPIYEASTEMVNRMLAVKE